MMQNDHINEAFTNVNSVTYYVIISVNSQRRKKVGGNPFYDAGTYKGLTFTHKWKNIE